MVALTRDFNIFASRFTTGISAVLLSRGYIAKAWNVCAFSGRFIRHSKSPAGKELRPIDRLHAAFQREASQ